MTWHTLEMHNRHGLSSILISYVISMRRFASVQILAADRGSPAHESHDSLEGGAAAHDDPRDPAQSHRPVRVDHFRRRGRLRQSPAPGVRALEVCRQLLLPRHHQVGVIARRGAPPRARRGRRRLSRHTRTAAGRAIGARLLRRARLLVAFARPHRVLQPTPAPAVRLAALEIRVGGR